MPDPVEEQLDQQAEEPGEETPAEETHDGFVTEKQLAERVGVQHKRFRDEERGRIKERDRADAAERELEELKGTNEPVVIPVVPDRNSETFEADMATRDAAITAQADQNAANERDAAQRKEKDEARVTAEAIAQNKLVANFDSNMVAHGLKAADVKAAVETVIGYGISEVFKDDLLEDPDGSLIVQYLAANPVEADEMNRMSNLGRVNHMNDSIRAKALLLKPKTSDAPDPPIVLDGGGAPKTAEWFEEGGKYDLGSS